MNAFEISAFLVVPALILSGCQEANTFQPPPPPSVTVAQPVVQTVTDYIEETGTTEASDYAQVRARVRGFLEKILFEPNDTVQEKDELYRIEKETYEAALDQANAELEQAEAQVVQTNASLAVAQAELKRADAEFKRAKRLLERDAITDAEYEQRESEFAVADAKVKKAESEILTAKARVSQAKAAKRDAQIDLDYTTVRSPIDGVVDKTQVYVGNLVGDGEATHLTTVVKYDPIYATFNISERSMLNLKGRVGERGEDGRLDKSSVKMFLGREVDQGYPFAGHLNYYDQAVDESTGTYRIRGEFPNPGPPHKLFPGLFVRIRVPVGEIADAILVPERAVASDQLGRYVLIVNPENEVERRDVELGTKLGGMVVVREGLENSERIVVEGIQRARVGEKVTPEEITLDPPADNTGGGSESSGGSPPPLNDDAKNQ